MNKQTQPSSKKPKDTSNNKQPKKVVPGSPPKPKGILDKIKKLIFKSSVISNQVPTTISSDDSMDLTNISVDELTTRCDEILNKLVSLRNLNTPDNQELVNSLSFFKVEFIKRNIISCFVDLIIESGFCDSFQRLIEKHFIVAVENNDEKMLDCLNNIFLIFEALTYYSKKLSERITDSLLLKTYMRFLEHQDFFDDGLSHKSKQIDDLVKSILITLFNLVHLQKVEGCKSLILEMNGVNILQNYGFIKNNMISYLSLVIQTYLVSEVKNDALNSNIETFTFVIQFLDAALNNRFFEDFTCLPEEILDAINVLAVTDANKLMLVQAGVLPYYFDVLKGKYDVTDKAVAMAALGLWMLSFKCRDEIMKIAGYMEVLSSAKNHKSEEVKEKVNGIIWELNQEKKMNAETEISQVQNKPQKKQHIFISYHRDCMATILKVRDHLKKEGFKTWVDKDDMSGFLLESMAMAVENAYVVLVCLSEKYKDSVYCRSEGEYVFRRQKPFIPLRLEENYCPDGWLGILVGNKLVLDFSLPTIFDSSMERLLKDLEEFKTEQTNEVATLNIVLPSHEFGGGIKTWTNSEVMDWLKTQKLDHLKEWFIDYDGKMLYELAVMKSNGVNFYCNHFSQLKMSFEDILRISSALNDLI